MTSPLASVSKQFVSAACHFCRWFEPLYPINDDVLIDSGMERKPQADADIRLLPDAARR
jgi:hypothetical protein